MGQCDYEKGDDGRMLSTVLDSAIFKCEHVEGQWSIEGILDKIAMHDPPFHTLIDTGALITGFSNKAVARELLARGLPNCDGVVFLDDEDRQKVLVRATGRVVNADQCGIPLTRRFAFYDQIHTTGMDIKHRVNAHAVVTLGKDMVFRDYVQGAYRMRGIGIGQTCTVIIIPEVQELMTRELTAAKMPTASVPKNDLTIEQTLTNIAAWLLLNSMHTEQIQWTMLCLQNVSNLYRKVAFGSLNKITRDNIQTGKASSDPASDAKAKQKKSKKDKTDARALSDDTRQDLVVFDESIDFSLENAVPDPVPFTLKLKDMLEKHEDHVKRADCGQIATDILEEVGKFLRLDGREINLDTEQEREQEQEQQKEVKAKRDQQVEVEKFVDREYSRSKETPEPWPVSLLADAPSLKNHPFYSLSTFKLRHQDRLSYPSFVMASSNYFNREWVGLRRLKNVVMILEWVPSLKRVKPFIQDADAACDPKLSESQQQNLEKAYQLLSFFGGSSLATKDIANAVEMSTFKDMTKEQVASLMSQYGKDGLMSAGKFEQMLRSGTVHDTHTDRYWVAVSLAEAETIRRILHVRKESSIVRDSDAMVALRYSPSTSPALIEFQNQRGTKVSRS